MTRSHWQANEYMKMAKLTQADVERQKAVQDEIDAAAKRFRRKEFLAMLTYYGCWIFIGLFLAYQLYQCGA